MIHLLIIEGRTPGPIPIGTSSMTLIKPFTQRKGTLLDTSIYKLNTSQANVRNAGMYLPFVEQMGKLNPAADGGLLHPYPCTVTGTHDYDFQTMFERDLRLHEQVYLTANFRSMDLCFYATDLVATKLTTIP